MTETTITFETCHIDEAVAALVMDWRNDPDTLAASYHREVKTWKGFWPEFRSLCESHGGRLAPLLALIDGRRASFVYFRPVAHPQQLAGQCVDISINIAPHERGKGLGSRIIDAACERLSTLGIDSVVAEARVENAASIKAFTSAGFENLGHTEKLIEDTGEKCAIVRMVRELTPTYWRRKRVYIIAEAGSNWRGTGDINYTAQARALIDVAVEAGADAVKFQTYRADTVYVANAGASDYLAEAGNDDDISDIFENLAMPYAMIPELASYCAEKNIDFMSTPFSPDDFAAIDDHVSVHKVASYELSHPHLIRLAARSGKPLVMSTGASSEGDIAWAVDLFHAEGGRDLCLMQCTAKYPAPPESLNLATITWLKERFGVAVGLSDHSRDAATAATAATALGARVIEKHFTLDNNLPGPDHSFALEPEELKQLVTAVRFTEQANGDGIKRVLAEERELAAYARRGLQALSAIAKGDVLKEGENFAILRPGNRKPGAHPRHLDDVEGKKARRDINPGDGVLLEDAGA